jgi:hypothetical protein
MVEARVIEGIERSQFSGGSVTKEERKRREQCRVEIGKRKIRRVSDEKNTVYKRRKEFRQIRRETKKETNESACEG